MHRTRRDGVNFLNDPRIAERIVSLVDTKEKRILEIGGGLGQLTRFIRNFRSLIIIEKDPDFAKRLTAMFPEATVMNADALRVEWPEFDVFLSNMPYSISSPLLERLWNSEFETGVVTVQKEVADRITAEPGTKDYSRLSVMMQMKFRIEREFDIPPVKFTPRPAVYSTVLRLRRGNDAIPEGFDSFLKTIFSQRRKKLRNIVKTDLFGDSRPEELSRTDLLEVFKIVSEQQRS